MKTKMPSPLFRTSAALILLAAASIAFAGPFRDRTAGRRGTTGASLLDEEDSPARAALPPGVRVIRDVSYGSDALQRFDVYLPAHPSGAPVIFMVHGGGWSRGDKGARSVVENKVAHWVPQGFVFISTNYRMIPDADPIEQAKDVALALSVAQQRAASWGADPARFILVGHSAGAHLVAMIATSPSVTAGRNIRRPAGAILLDSAALDVPRIMESRHFPLYDRAFGTDPKFWRAASPFHEMRKGDVPILSVCSSRRADSCDQASRFVEKETSLGARASVLQEDLSHREINTTLGQEGEYTRAVEKFVVTAIGRRTAGD
jgi:acetyl esterase/lipase